LIAVMSVSSSRCDRSFDAAELPTCLGGAQSDVKSRNRNALSRMARVLHDSRSMFCGATLRPYGRTGQTGSHHRPRPRKTADRQTLAMVAPGHA
jgi:hypothetical protein